MSHLCVLICRVDDESQPDHLTELHRLELPATDAHQLEAATALDHLETQATTAGREVARRVLLGQWEAVDRQLVADYQRLFPPGSGAL